MASAYLQNLIARRDNIAAELAALTVSKPDYSIEGESVQHTGNRAGLINELKELNQMITRATPWKIQTRGRV